MLLSIAGDTALDYLQINKQSLLKMPRPCLAAAPLRFANPSLSSGWTEDFHLQAVDHARHTKGKAPATAEAS
jgi:hypothetical protein